jgi:hypothetical protein
MSIAVIMDGASLAGTPDEDEKITLPIALVHQVPSVAPAVVAKSIPFPFFTGTIISSHESHQVFDVDVVAG